MITINNEKYICNSFQYHKHGPIEHVSITITGELPKENKLHIKYCMFDIKIIKNLPKFENGVTHFLGYILQEGDSEA